MKKTIFYKLIKSISVIALSFSIALSGVSHVYAAGGISLDSNLGATARFSAVSTITQAFTNTSGTYMVIAFACNNDLMADPTSVLYNGVAATKLASAKGGGNGEGTFVYGLASPATGTNNITVNLGASLTCDLGATTYTGIAGTDGTFSSTNVTSAGATAVETITTTKNNDWMVAFAGLQRSSSASTNSTLRSGVSSGGNLFDSNAAITPIQTYSMSQTMGSAGSFNGVAVAFYPTQTVASFSFWQFQDF